MARLATLWTLGRPKMLPWLLLLLLVGYGYGHWERAVDLAWPEEFALLVPIWVLLHFGTMWLNAARDKDEGPLMFGEAVAVPPYVAKLGYLALLGCLGLAMFAHPVARLCAIGCVLLAVFYSHPWTAWKAHPVGGPLVNVLGYGVLTPLAGLAVTRAELGWRVLFTFTCTGLAMLGLTFAAQAWQGAEDAARGDRTLVVTHGPRVTLWTARICIGLAALGGTFAAAVGFYPRACLLALPGLFVVDRHFARWIAKGEGGPEDAKGLLLRMAVSALVLIGAALATYLYQYAQGLPMAGMGTAL